MFEVLKSLGRVAIRAYLTTSLRGGSRLLNIATYLGPRGGVELVRFGSYVLPLDHRIRATLMMAYRVYERDELKQLARIIPNGGTILDLGANVGYCSARFAEMVGPEGKVYSFEPAPICLENLRKLEASSDSSVIQIVPKGVAESTRTTIYYETEKTVSHGFGRLDERPSDRHTVTREEQVEVTSIDDFCAENSIDHINFIKIDVEGAEVSVLRGMQNWFSSGKRPLILLEMTGADNCRQENAEIASILKPLGYSSFLLTDEQLPVDVHQLPSGFHGNVLWKTPA